MSFKTTNQDYLTLRSVKQDLLSFQLHFQNLLDQHQEITQGKLITDQKLNKETQ